GVRIAPGAPFQILLNQPDEETSPRASGLFCISDLVDLVDNHGLTAVGAWLSGRLVRVVRLSSVKTAGPGLPSSFHRSLSGAQYMTPSPPGVFFTVLTRSTI